MLLGIIADDFTGASDVANTVAKGLPNEGGFRTVQYLGIPDRSAPAEVEAGVIALKSRSIAAADAVEQSLEALDWLIAQGCPQILFKYCSTFDSTPEGNIGPVAEALARRLNANGVVVCPAFPDAGRTVYQGYLFVGDRLLNESGMESHPLNPMPDADLRRWLALQTQEAIGHLRWSAVQSGSRAIRDELAAHAAQGNRLVVADALTHGDLLAIGEACEGAPLLTGGSGIAMGLPRNFIRVGAARGGLPVVDGVEGPEAILVGSCSSTAMQQIEVHAKSHPVLAIDVNDAMRSSFSVDELVSFVCSHSGDAPVVYSTSRPQEVAALQRQYGAKAIAHALDRIFAATAVALFEAGVRRIVVGGGETSGAVVSALGITSFQIGPEIDPGIPVLFAENKTGLGMALKSGNFGAPDFFEKALRMIARPERRDSR